MTPTASELLDRATCAREVAVMTALVLMAPGVEGDHQMALGLLDESRDIALPESAAELDAVAIAHAAIVEAALMQGKDVMLP